MAETRDECNSARLPRGVSATMGLTPKCGSYRTKEKGRQIALPPNFCINDFYFDSDQNVTDILTKAVRPMMS
jgi:hypothetical protein